METKKEEIMLVDWLNTSLYELLLKHYTREEIQNRLLCSGFTVEDLTDLENYRQEPTWLKIKQLVKENHQFTVKEYCGEWSKEITVRGFRYRVKAKYQGLKHSKILRAFLNTSFEWFSGFNWDLYEVSNADTYEIYLKTSKGSLYVPLEALYNKDFSLIENRMKTYWSWYCKESNYNLNHKKDETLGQFNERKEAEFQAYMQILETEEAQRLRLTLANIS